MKLAEAFKHLITAKDGQTVAFGRVSGLATLLSGLVLPFWALFKGQTVSFADLGIYFGGLAGGITALVRGTDATEPQPPTGGQ